MTKYKEGADGERKGSAEAESASGPQILFEIFFVSDGFPQRF